MIVFTSEQQNALDLVDSGNNVFITGPGGTGKSVVVREILRRYPDDTILLAPTGISALNIGGVTIHSAFRLPFHLICEDDWGKIQKETRMLFDRKGPVERIIIDEISMVRLDVFKAIDQMLRRIRKNAKPFGGLQIIVVGDFYQLPPVITNQEKEVYHKYFKSLYCFGDITWTMANFQPAILTKSMRQDNMILTEMLDNIRTGKNLSESLEFFNIAGTSNTDEVYENDPTYVCTTNSDADYVNSQMYNSLDTREVVYYGKLDGNFSGQKPSPMTLKLRFGTKVIVTANGVDHKNGQIGYVVSTDKNSIKIISEDSEEEINIPLYTWEEKEYRVNPETGKLAVVTVGKYTQLPVKMGWGITVHKSQGQTLSNMILDIGRGAFCHGQTYVALSRMKDISGFALVKKLSRNDIIIDDEVREFYENGCVAIKMEDLHHPVFAGIMGKV